MAEPVRLPRIGAPAVAAPRDRSVWRRSLDAIHAVLTSEIGAKFRLLFAAIFVALIGINGLNVVNSYVGRNFVTAIEERSPSSFFSMALLWLAVLAALTGAAVLVRFIEERLGLLWREWLTRRLVGGYLEGGVYLRLKEEGRARQPRPTHHGRCSRVHDHHTRLRALVAQCALHDRGVLGCAVVD